MNFVTLIAGTLLTGWMSMVQPIQQGEKMYGESDPAATELLQQVADKHAGYTSFKADFELKIDVPETDDDIKSTGAVYVKGKKFKLDTENELIITDNKSIWTYIKDYNEVQINYFETDDQTLTPDQLFDFYKDDYIARIKSESYGGTVIEMTPIDKALPYFKVDVSVNTVDKTLSQIILYEKNGVKTIYTIKSMQKNIGLTDAFFDFKAEDYPGVSVFDMR